MGIARLPRIIAWLQRVQVMLTSPFQGMLIWTRAGRGATFSARQQRQESQPIPAASPPPVLPGAGRALLNPPGVAPSLEYMRRMSPRDRYLLPLGWQTTGRPQPDLVHTALVGETNHVLISGASDSGKDNLAWWMLLSLTLAHPAPHELQVAIVDGKGLDFQPWQAKAQTWALATDPEEIPDLLRGRLWVRSCNRAPGRAAAEYRPAGQPGYGVRAGGGRRALWCWRPQCGSTFPLARERSVGEPSVV